VSGARRHIVLVGLPGCGKTTVGRLVAGHLGARFVDLDTSVAERAGAPVERIFAERGEPAFRLLERSEMLRALLGEAGVLAPGGGWAAQAGNLEAAADRAVTIYLSLTAAEAARRIGPSGAVRPLLAGKDATLALAELLAAREPFYQRCQSVVDVAGRSPEWASTEVAKLARSLGGW